MKGLLISEEPHSLNHRCFVLGFFDFFVFSTIFSLFRKIIMEHSLSICLSLLCVKNMKIVYSAAQEIKHIWKLTSGFIGPQILSFERSLSMSPGPQKAALFRLAHFSWSFACFCDISLGGLPVSVIFLLEFCLFL